MNPIENFKREQAALLTKVKNEKRKNFTPEEQARFDFLQCEITNAMTEIALREPVNADGPRIDVSNRQHHTPSLTKPRDYKNIFGVKNIDRSSFPSHGDFYQAVRSPSISNLASGLTPADGGFAIPEQQASFLIDRIIEDSIFLSRATIYPMKSDTLKIPAFDACDKSNGVIYGFSGGWVAEGSAGTLKTAPMRALNMTARKLMLLAQVTNELLNDSQEYGRALNGAMVSAASWILDDAFFNGNGAGTPLGVLNSAATISVAKEANQTPATIVWENLAKMLEKMLPSGFMGCEWFAHTSCMAQLLTLGMPVGQGALPVPGLQQQGGKWMLAGIPLTFTEKLPTLGTAGSLILGNLSFYGVALRQDLVIDRSNAPGFLSDIDTWRGIVRADGASLLDKPVKLKDAVTTVSPFVKLAA